MTWVQTESGKAFDLLAPVSRDVDFTNDVAPSLAKINRFSGHTRGWIGYSVAQHSVLGAEEIFKETGNQLLAAQFVLHDAHETYIGDLATPTAQTLVRMIGPAFSPAIAELKGRLDLAIYAAAGVPLPSPDAARAIRKMDLRMMLAERNGLMTKPPKPWAVDGMVVPAFVDPLDLQPWEAEVASSEWLDAYERFVTVNVRH